MVAELSSAIPAWHSGGSSSLDVPDHRALRTPTFSCLCSLESLDVSPLGGEASHMEPSEATIERMG